MNQQKIEKELRFLKIYAVVATLACAVFFLTAFSVSRKAKFDEIPSLLSKIYSLKLL